MTPYDVHLLDLRRRIRDYAAKAPPEFEAQADANAALELADVRERLLCCDTDEDDDPLDETQPCDPVPLRHQMIETQLHADHPLLDDVDRLMDHFEDTRFVRLWASSLRQRSRETRGMPY